MNAWKKILVTALFVLVLVFTWILSGCRTTGGLSERDAEIVRENSYIAGQLEATVGGLEVAVAGGRERIAGIIEASEGIADEIERLEFLFGRYEQEVERVFSEIDRIRNQAENAGENHSGGMDRPRHVYMRKGHASAAGD